jgi:hypothetical protein
MELPWFAGDLFVDEGKVNHCDSQKSIINHNSMQQLDGLKVRKLI